MDGLLVGSTLVPGREGITTALCLSTQQRQFGEDTGDSLNIMSHYQQWMYELYALIQSSKPLAVNKQQDLFRTNLNLTLVLCSESALILSKYNRFRYTFAVRQPCFVIASLMIFLASSMPGSPSARSFSAHKTCCATPCHIILSVPGKTVHPFLSELS